MTSSAPLPIIDISPFLSSISTPSQRASAASEIHNACVKYGFFYVSHTNISPKEFDESIAVAREFFARPTEEKQVVHIRQGDAARGYQLLGENVTQNKVDHQEGWDAYKPISPEDPTKFLHGPNLWPSEPQNFRPVMENWIEKGKVLGRAINEAIAQGLGVDMDGEEWAEMERLTKDSFWVLRAIAYPPLPEEAPGVSCGTHADYGLINHCAHADSTKGALHVFLPDHNGPEEELGRKGRWIQADPIPGCFVVNIGEMWEVWSNELYKATLHRVIWKSKGSSTRVSLPFFSEPNYDALIKPLPAALRLQSKLEGKQVHPRKEPVVYKDFLYSKVSKNFTFSATKEG